MTDALGPAFGEADLTNCERELIHLTGSVQGHGALLVVDPGSGRVLQASRNTDQVLGLPVDDLLGRPLAMLGEAMAAQVAAAAAPLSGDDLDILRARAGVADAHGGFELAVHRLPDGPWVVEFEPRDRGRTAAPCITMAPDRLRGAVDEAIGRIGEAATVVTLADALVRNVRDLLGHDRVMVYRFDADGHGQVIAEARDPRLDPLLGHHYPASDIPQRARSLYLRNRLRVLVDVNAAASPIVPQRRPDTDGELDLSMATLRSMSPLHLQYLRNMGVSATLTVSLVREGALWGLIACHHNSPLNVDHAARSAADLMAEVASTRLAAIEQYAHAQVAIQVRRLEQRLIEATSTEGDWRLALFRNPATLLQPLDATGAALWAEGEVLTAGEVPSTPALRALLPWIERHAQDGLFHTSSVERLEPSLAGLTPVASGVIAVPLAPARSEWLAWFRREQLQTVTWAGDPAKPMVGNDPLNLSPRRSFAAWSEIVRGTALPWSVAERAMARAFGDALIDIVAQVNAVRLLVAEHQLVQVRGAVDASQEAVVIVDARRRVLEANPAFAALAGACPPRGTALDEVVSRLEPPVLVQRMLDTVFTDHRPWRGDLSLRTLPDGTPRPVAVRAEPVPARDGSALGMILLVDDLTERRRADAARQQLERSLSETSARPAAMDDDGDTARREARSADIAVPDPLLGTVVANATMAAMDIADGQREGSMAPLLEELESSTRRAATLVRRIRRLQADGPAGAATGRG